MLTYAESIDDASDTADDTAGPVRDDRPPYRPYRLRVARLTVLSPLFTRVTFTGDALEHFGTDGLDQRIKIILPAPGSTGYADFLDDPAVHLDGSWYLRIREMPTGQRHPFRTYTVRAIRPEARELDVDFVVHDTPPNPDGSRGADGPAGAWLRAARPGDELVIVGPDVRSIHSATGLDWRPGDANQVLLAGDETAAPAICAILEQLPADVTAHAFIEVPDADHVIPRPDGSRPITWLHRGATPVGTALVPAARVWLAAHPAVVAPALAAGAQLLEEIDVDVDTLWDSPEAEHRGFYAWLAGESSAIKTLRRMLVTESGIDRHAVAFMGYWRAGQGERQE